MPGVRALLPGAVSDCVQTRRHSLPLLSLDFRFRPATLPADYLSARIVCTDASVKERRGHLGRSFYLSDRRPADDAYLPPPTARYCDTKGEYGKI